MQISRFTSACLLCFIILFSSVIGTSREAPNHHHRTTNADLCFSDTFVHSRIHQSTSFFILILIFTCSVRIERPSFTRYRTSVRFSFLVAFFSCSFLSLSDMKPDNVMMHFDRNIGKIIFKITDFGLSKQVTNDEQELINQTRCGFHLFYFCLFFLFFSGVALLFIWYNPSILLLLFINYLPLQAPEMLNGTAYDGKVDVFAVGVMAYVLVYGRHPFGGKSIMDLITFPFSSHFHNSLLWFSVLFSSSFLQQIYPTIASTRQALSTLKGTSARPTNDQS